jgi:hypothetical protein
VSLAPLPPGRYARVVAINQDGRRTQSPWTSTNEVLRLWVELLGENGFKPAYRVNATVIYPRGDRLGAVEIK